MLDVHTVKIAVILVADLLCRFSDRNAVIDKLACKGNLFLQNILLGRDIHFLLEQMAK